jgi:Rha family phage regulatory protein
MITDQKAVTTSLIISDAFEKNHRDVLRAISKLECSKEFTERNFAPSGYMDSTGRTLPMFNITRDGFSLLATGGATI